MAHDGNKHDHSGSPKSSSLEELIRAQGIKPVTDLNKLGALLPDDHDPDAFMAFVAEERAAKRGFRDRRHQYTSR